MTYMEISAVLTNPPGQHPLKMQNRGQSGGFSKENFHFLSCFRRLSLRLTEFAMQISSRAQTPIKGG